MDHLEPVSILQMTLRPACPGDDLAVVFDRDAISLQPQFGYKLVQCCCLCKGGKGSGLTVENKRKRHDNSSLAGRGTLSIPCCNSETLSRPTLEAASDRHNLRAGGEDFVTKASEQLDRLTV